nr:hypothetical protein GCM10020092_028270 [Actinoplanes digitatis]
MRRLVSASPSALCVSSVMTVLIEVRAAFADRPSWPTSSVEVTFTRRVRSPSATAASTLAASLIGPVMLRVISQATTAATAAASRQTTAMVVTRPSAMSRACAAPALSTPVSPSLILPTWKIAIAVSATMLRITTRKPAPSLRPTLRYEKLHLITFGSGLRADGGPTGRSTGRGGT